MATIKIKDADLTDRYYHVTGEGTASVPYRADVPDPRISHAINVISSQYGDTVSVFEKAKDLRKFGRNATVGTSFETIANLQGATANETFVSTNIIDSIVSSNAGDTQIITIEGHTIDGSGNLTFVTQNATLTGQTEVTLTTPLARANRAFVADSGVFDSPQAALAGTVYVYDNTGGITSGVPNTAAATKVMIDAGETQSQKCSTSISSTDYWLLDSFSAAVGVAGGSANRVELRLEIRDVFNGGVWRPAGRFFELNVADGPESDRFDPMVIIPKNHDVRIVAKTDSSTAEVTAEMAGYLAIIT